MENHIKQKVLILFGDGTQTPPMAKSLAKHGYEVHAIFESKWSYGFGSRYIKKKYLCEDLDDELKYIAFVLKVVRSIQYATILPMHDESAALLSKYKDELLKFTHFVMPDYEVFESGFDKHRLMEICKKHGYPHPKTTLVDGGSLDGIDLDVLHYPLLIKPNHTCGARGMTFCKDKSDLIEKFPTIYKEYGDCHLQRFVPEGGHQVEVQLYVNEKNELIQTSVIKKFRWYPEKGGSSCCNISCENDSIVHICYSILKDIGWIGFADFDTIEDPVTGELLIMEINPRVPACLRTPMMAGIDWGDVIVSEYLGKEHKKYKMEREIYLRHLGFEMLWFAYSKNRFKTKPSWFRFIGRKIYYQDMNGCTDFRPFFRGTIGNILKQLSPEFRAAKNGTR